MPTIAKRPNNSVYTQVLCKNAASVSSAELLNGIQNVSFDTAKQITELSKLGKFGTQDRILNSNQTTNLNIDFILDDQKSNDPFFKNTSSGFLSTDKFNFLIKDLAGTTSINGAYLTNYSLQLSAGGPAIGQLQYEADSISYSESGAISLNQVIAASNFGDALRPSKIFLKSSSYNEGVSTDTFLVQSVNVSAAINRTPVTRIGQRTPQFRYPDPNTNGNINVSIIKNQLKEIDLSSLVLEKGSLVIELNTSEEDNFEQYTFLNCSLISVSEGTTLDGNTTIDFSYSFNLKDNNNILNV
jgi:hypothetical protein